MGRGQKSFEVHVTKSLDCHEGIFGRNMYVKGGYGESLEREKELEGLLGGSVF